MNGGSLVYDATFAIDPNVGGYPSGAVLLRTAAQGTVQGFWLNTQDDNVTDPEATDGSALGWAPLNADWNAASGPAQILHRPDLAAAATMISSARRRSPPRKSTPIGTRRKAWR